MATEIRVPTLGESVVEATVGNWLKKAGEAVNQDEAIVELETDKVTVEVNAPVAGVIADVLVAEGETVEVGALLGSITEGEGAASSTSAAEASAAPAPAAASAAPQTAAAPAASSAANGGMPPAPSARKMMEENNIDPASVAGSGKRGRS